MFRDLFLWLSVGCFFSHQDLHEPPECRAMTRANPRWTKRWNCKLSRVRATFSFLHVHCTFLACGQSVHYGRCFARSLARFLLIHNIYPQFLIMIFFPLPWKHFFSFFSFLFLNVIFSVVRECLRVNRTTTMNKKTKWEEEEEVEKETKVQSESWEWIRFQTPHRPITPSLISCLFSRFMRFGLSVCSALF